VLAKRRQFHAAEHSQARSVSAARRDATNVPANWRAGRGPAIYLPTSPPAYRHSSQPAAPYYGEDRPELVGLCRQSVGIGIRQRGVSYFLSTDIYEANPRQSDARCSSWRPDTRLEFRFQHSQRGTSGLIPAFLKAYGHNGLFTQPEQIDAFLQQARCAARCQPDDPGEGNASGQRRSDLHIMSTSKVGRLGLCRTQTGVARSFYSFRLLLTVYALSLLDGTAFIACCIFREGDTQARSDRIPRAPPIATLTRAN